jgi:hypothetical protein
VLARLESVYNFVQNSLFYQCIETQSFFAFSRKKNLLPQAQHADDPVLPAAAEKV